jgi:hypothetical protein
MSLLPGSNWLKLDGTPRPGVVPPQVVLMSGKMNEKRQSELMHAYKLFCLSKTTMAGDYLVSTRKLSDGTRVRLESMQNIDRALVWAQDTEEDWIGFPHGFGVATDWQDPRFYWKPDKTTWKVTGKSPPQLDKPDVTYNHVTFELEDGGKKRWEFFPLVHSEQAKKLYTWLPRTGLEMTHKDAAKPEPGYGSGSKNSVVPIALRYSDGEKMVRTSAHYAVDDWILGVDGQKLYSMDAVEPMTLNGSDPLRKLPPCSDATGTQVALQQWRRWLSSPTFSIYHFRLCDEVLERVGPKQYERKSRSTEEFSTRLRLPDKDYTSGDLDESPEDPHLSRMASIASGVWQVGTEVAFDPYWSGHLQWCTYGVYFFALGEAETGGETLRASTGGWLRKSGPLRPQDEYAKFIAVPEWSGIGHCRLINELAYPPTVFLQAGSKDSRIRAMLKDVTSCYGLAAHSIYRRSVEHEIKCRPSLTLDFGWLQFKSLEGDIEGEYKAHSHLDVKIYKNSYLTLEAEQESEGAWYTHADIGAIPHEDGPGVFGYNRVNAMLAGLVDFSGMAAEYPSNNVEVPLDEDILEPTCTVDYSYQSRYILDFDNRAQFCAAIRVEMTCTGASWSQIPGKYLGALQSDGPSSYTAKIYFEATVGTTTIDKLLVEEFVTKEAWEVRAILYDNVLIWPQADIDKPLYVYMPPELIPPMEAHMHLEAITKHQGVNTNFAGHDIPGKDAKIPPKQVSETQLEYSRYNGKTVIPHPKRPTGLLYARTFTLSEFIDEAMWMFGKEFLKFDAPKNLNYKNPDTPLWHYFQKLGAAITSGDKIHIEVRDAAFVDWSDDIPTRKGATKPRPKKTERDIEVYYV